MRLLRGSDTTAFDIADQRTAGAAAYARKADASTDTRGTVLDADAINAILRELVHLATLGGQTLDPTGDHDQAATALQGAQGITSASASGGGVSSGTYHDAAAIAAASPTVSGAVSVVLGGTANSAAALGSLAGGGGANVANAAGASALGGSSNTASGARSAALGGTSNTASGDDAAALGGDGNTASGARSAALGGTDRTVDGDDAAALGGNGGRASGAGAAVLGGQDQIASGDGSIALGVNCEVGTSQAIGGGYNTGATITQTGSDQNLDWKIVHNGGAAMFQTLRLEALPVYADNADAKTSGGLTDGDLYRVTGTGTIQIVYT